MKKLILSLIRLYQAIPGSFHFACRFQPTCSQYLYDAINKYGILKGTRLGVVRLAKCHPLGGHGYDPVK